MPPTGSMDGSGGFRYLPDPPTGGRHPRVSSARGVFSALGLSLLFILVYYIAQTFAQLAYALILMVGDVMLSGDLQIDIWSVLERVESRYTIIASIYALMLIGAYAVIIRARGRGRTTYVRMARPAPAQVWAALAVSLGMLGTANLAYVGLDWLGRHTRVFGDWMADYEKVVESAFTSEAGVGWLILGVCVLVPIAEELLFRGIVQAELSAVMHPWLAVLVQALLFSLFHMQAVQSMYVFLPGFVMGAAYLATGSILVPILMHMLFNFIGSGALETLTGGSEAVGQALYAAQYGFILVGALCLVWMFKSRARPGSAEDRKPIPSENEVSP